MNLVIIKFVKYILQVTGAMTGVGVLIFSVSSPEQDWSRIL